MDDAQFPEHGLYGRVKLAFEWIPPGTRALLDAGCSYGYAARFFTQKAGYVAGADPNAELVAIAKRRYPQIDFRVCAMERTPFSDGSFDTVVLLDVLEHVAGERETLDEIYRILAPGGRLILTVPHAGLFAFLDIDNVALAIRKYVPALYDALFYLKERRMPERRPGYENWHRHYTYEALSALLTSSRFARGFTIERVRYCGLIMDAVVSIAYQAARALLGFERANAVLAALNPLYSADYAVDYGRLSYNIALCVTKTASRA